ncbi:RsmF rRNA methyltransferase first C-terminal domain-containing protein [Streptococcus equi]|uniref:RsmF rRNA methyltransferase first C-terminal domain-containing protein n=1 Tax=Streptococcus equi TaxID=1336 RepID=UPI000F6D1153|nr:tRNA and rRNA cytosine-C5-methylase [Streptococcus equi subsp. equi]HEK9097292.1 RsmF rRNA methyltransferase first C-terminal domain-containing protein [Streptococcus equi subsp. zooepidemicus]HEL1217905.1 RsmF rRNA methyltransferase first C-terminal domain-containing protein [Streptococcus equi subsp. zooepidemicus]
MQLPNDFIEKYQQLLGSEAKAFFESFDQPAISAYRINPLKHQSVCLDPPIPDTLWGYYGRVSGKSPDHVSGVVYSQEPAAQMVAQVASPAKGTRVLDLAAAPGGKSTQLLAYLENTGLLVSNEISTKRSKALVENIERFGARNVIVTNESADRLAAVFPEYFDTIVFDGPCSGEGMFRKDPNAVSYWHKDYPAACASLQRSILAETIPMLKPGGQLIYSTCTWSPEENEEVVRWLLESYDFLELEHIPKINGMAEGIGMPQAARMYPHRFKGEGQFVAKLKDTRSTISSSNYKSPRSNLTQEQLRLWQDFEKNHLNITLSGLLQVFGDRLYLLPDGLPCLRSLKIARNGLELGTFKKKRFEPSYALGLALRPEEVSLSVEIDEEDFITYASGNTITLPESYATDWYQLVINGNGLGFAKIVGPTLKNSFPKGLRF